MLYMCLSQMFTHALQGNNVIGEPGSTIHELPYFVEVRFGSKGFVCKYNFCSLKFCGFMASQKTLMSHYKRYSQIP